FQIGLVVFAVGSLLCSLAPDIETLIVRAEMTGADLVSYLFYLDECARNIERYRAADRKILDYIRLFASDHEQFRILHSAVQQGSWAISDKQGCVVSLDVDQIKKAVPVPMVHGLHFDKYTDPEQWKEIERSLLPLAIESEERRQALLRNLFRAADLAALNALAEIQKAQNELAQFLVTEIPDLKAYPFRRVVGLGPNGELPPDVLPPETFTKIDPKTYVTGIQKIRHDRNDIGQVPTQPNWVSLFVKVRDGDWSGAPMEPQPKKPADTTGTPATGNRFKGVESYLALAHEFNRRVLGEKQADPAKLVRSFVLEKKLTAPRSAESGEYARLVIRMLCAADRGFIDYVSGRKPDEGTDAIPPMVQRVGLSVVRSRIDQRYVATHIFSEYGGAAAVSASKRYLAEVKKSGAALDGDQCEIVSVALESLARLAEKDSTDKLWPRLHEMGELVGLVREVEHVVKEQNLRDHIRNLSVRVHDQRHQPAVDAYLGLLSDFPKTPGAKPGLTALPPITLKEEKAIQLSPSGSESVGHGFHNSGSLAHTACAISPDLNHLAAVSDTFGVVVFDLARQSSRVVYKHQNTRKRVNQLCWSPDGKSLAWASFLAGNIEDAVPGVKEGEVTAIDVNSGKVLLSQSATGKPAIGWDAKGTRLALSCWGAEKPVLSVAVYDLATGRPVLSTQAETKATHMPSDKSVRDVRFGAKGDSVLVIADAVEFHPDGRTHIVKEFDVASGKESTGWHYADLFRPSRADRLVQLIPAGRTIAAFNASPSGLLHNTADGKALSALGGNGTSYPLALTASSDGKWLAVLFGQVGSLDGPSTSSLRILDQKTLRPVTEVSASQNGGHIRAFSFDASSSKLSVCYRYEEWPKGPNGSAYDKATVKTWTIAEGK
ncbi:MAG: hypothetical protein K2V38_23795, partial [Gemmataceae bacterium]|nr:hypothetical protein [Gemmataceae bacterium]